MDALGEDQATAAGDDAWARLQRALQPYFANVSVEMKRGARSPFDILLAACTGVDAPEIASIAQVLQEETALARALYVDAGGTPVLSFKPSMIWNFLLGPLVAQFMRDMSGDADPADVVALLVEKLRGEVAAPEEEVVIVMPIRGLDLPDGGIDIGVAASVRPLELEEIESWMRIGMLNRDFPFALQDINCKVEVRSKLPRPRDGEPAERLRREMLASQEAWDILCAIQLCADTTAGAVFVERRSTSVLAMGHMFSSVAHAQLMGARGRFPADLASQVREAAQAISRSRSDAVLDLGLRRWSDAQGRNRPDDQMLDSWIALEALLCSDSTQEVMIRAALRLAALVGGEGDRQRTYDEARKSYHCRSSIIHGANLSKFDLPAEAKRVRSWLRNVLLKFLDEGRPSDISSLEKGLLTP